MFLCTGVEEAQEFKENALMPKEPIKTENHG